MLDRFQRVLDDYDEATGELGINDQTKKTRMIQLLPGPIKTATRDSLMAARTTVKEVTPE